MTSRTLEWLMVAAAMIVFTCLALAGRWTDLGIAITICAVIWYTLVPERQTRRQ